MTQTLSARLRELSEEWFECCGDIHEPLTEAATRLEQAEKLAEALVQLMEWLDPLGDRAVFKEARQALASWNPVEGEKG